MTRNATSLTKTHIAAWARLTRVSGQVVQAVEAALKAESLPPLAWYDLLLELKRVDPEGLRPYRLQGEMLIPQYNMSRLIDRIESAGLLERIPCNDDRRGQVVRITTSGKAMLRRMWPVYSSVLAEKFAENISNEAAEELLRILPASVPS